MGWWGQRTCGERGCGLGWMSPFALWRLQLSSSPLSRSVQTVPSPRLYLLGGLLRALLAFASGHHWFFTSVEVVLGEAGGKVLVNLAIPSFAAVPWLVKAPPGLLPRALFALEDALRFSDARWAETRQCPARRRGQCVYTWKMALRGTRPQTKTLSDHFPKSQKILNFKVWACSKPGSGNYMLARSQQTVRAASVVFG